MFYLRRGERSQQPKDSTPKRCFSSSGTTKTAAYRLVQSYTNPRSSEGNPVGDGLIKPGPCGSTDKAFIL
ncbi:hypothetical protein GCM10010840_14720 [Deinococcus aerolatus]|uniref:Uncharacterized protein n=1 Tax=Deinococcus aerolatus TaxID=522487 RepID=A0ABQ2G6S0_9DEIO|nr:hypothetical protein GCM10010840_14720 [Deinococcus aerolatus]